MPPTVSDQQESAIIDAAPDVPIDTVLLAYEHRAARQQDPGAPARATPTTASERSHRRRSRPSSSDRTRPRSCPSSRRRSRRSRSHWGSASCSPSASRCSWTSSTARSGSRGPRVRGPRRARALNAAHRVPGPTSPSSPRPGPASTRPTAPSPPRAWRPISSRAPSS